MILPLRRYAEFQGRSRRKEYWLYTLFVFILSAIAAIIDRSLNFVDAGGGPVNGVLSLALLCPGIAVSVRRLHDIDRSGWWLLLFLLPIVGWIVLLVWACTDGTTGSNGYGVDPKNPDGDLTAIFR